MALSVTDVQGTKLYLAATTVATGTVTEIEAAILAGTQIGCLQAIGDITETKTVTEYTCISSDESTKSIGSKSLGNQELSTLFNALDTEGQSELRTMFAGNERRKLIIELTDMPSGGTNPTYIVYEIFISVQTHTLQKDNAVMYNATVEISSSPIVTDAA